jgi:glyceraldehyde 3-phosphate dehydrogenase
MTVKVAINGFGRIGRNVLRALYENKHSGIKVVAINDLTPVETNAHLLKYDSVHGKFNHEVTTTADGIIINGDHIKVTAERDPTKCPWGALDVDVVFECTGIFRSREKANLHLQAGAKKVLISAPASGDVDATIVYGVNDNVLTAKDTVVSNASCTTNCLAPIVKPLHDALEITAGLMVTVHSYTNDQFLTDSAHSDLRRARSATQSMIPTSTGAAAAVGLVLPDLAGKLDGYAMRVPTVNVSVVDLTFACKKPSSVAEVNNILQVAAAGSLKGILSYNTEPLVSIDYNHNPHSSNFDATQTLMAGGLIKVVSWYDNEWGFSNRMLDTAKAMMRAK